MPILLPLMPFSLKETASSLNAAAAASETAMGLKKTCVERKWCQKLVEPRLAVFQFNKGTVELISHLDTHLVVRSSSLPGGGLPGGIAGAVTSSVVEDGDDRGLELKVLGLCLVGAEQGSNNGSSASASDDLTAVGRERHLNR